MSIPLAALAETTVALLKQQQQKLVLAESCTCGRVAAALGLVPGVSQFLCGSMVVYRATSKQEWLKIDADLIQRYSTESQECSEALAKAILRRTPEANIAAAITGDLGPGVDEARDGKIFISTICRDDSAIQNSSLQLVSNDRESRQAEAAAQVLQAIIGRLQAVN